MSDTEDLFSGQEPEDQGTPAPDESDSPSTQASTETETKVEDKTADEEKRDTQVPYAALHEERMRRREIEQQMGQQRELMARMEERFASLQERLSPKEEAPSYDEDPAAYLRHQNEQLAAQLAELKGGADQQQQAAQQQQHYEQFRNHFQGLEAEFARTHADYYDAIGYLRDSRAQELARFGYSPEQIQGALTWEAHQLAQNALAAGQQPAEAFYEIAKTRGYKANENGEQGKGKGDEVAKLQELAKNKERAGGMGPGSGDEGEVTLARLAEMSEEEFEEATKGDRWRALWQ